MKEGSSAESLRSILAGNRPTKETCSKIRDFLYGAGKISAADFQAIHRSLLAPSFDKLSELPSLKVAILGNVTITQISQTVASFLFAEGFRPTIYEVPFDTYRQEILDETSGLYAFQPDFVVLAISPYAIPELRVFERAEKQNGFASEHLGLIRLLGSRTKARILHHTLESLDVRTLGRLEAHWEHSLQGRIDAFNLALHELEPASLLTLDVASLARNVGIQNWFDPKWFNYGKLPFSSRYLAHYGRMFAGTVRAALGRSKKCLVTDLDNTLWGGVLGDLGIAGVEVGTGSPAGEAFSSFCAYLRNLKSRGVILAISSKNEPEVVKEMFSTHREIPLRWNDFSAVRCNWDHKSKSIASIAKELNIGIDSLVFVDDNPVECAEVRELLPEVTVLEMNMDPSLFSRALDGLHLFDQIDITQEDLDRTDSYRAQRQLEEERSRFSNLNDFFKNIEMRSRIEYVQSDDLARVEQLFIKTNQFNLTGKKYTRADLERISSDNSVLAISARLKDRLSDYGLVSALILSHQGETVSIENWVMSCRVFSRTFEQHIFNSIVEIARERGARRLRGHFLETPKNGYVKELFPKLGFTQLDRGNSWTLELSSETVAPTFVKRELV